MGALGVDAFVKMNGIVKSAAWQLEVVARFHLSVKSIVSETIVPIWFKVYAWISLVNMPS